MKDRCGWARTPANIAYHDKEWGVPAGLSWETILNKRANYRKAFAGFDPRKISRFSSSKIQLLMQDAGIVRNRLKIESTWSMTIWWGATGEEKRDPRLRGDDGS